MFKSRGAWLEAIESGRWDAGTLERGRLGAGWEMRTVVLSFPQALGGSGRSSGVGERRAVQSLRSRDGSVSVVFFFCMFLKLARVGWVGWEGSFLFVSRAGVGR